MNGFKLVATGLLAALLAAPSFAMETPPAGPETEVPDEVTVVGQRTILALRLQMEAAQDEVHLLFNELNANDSYDIVCKNVDRYFSKVKDKQCKPQFAWNAISREGQSYARQLQGDIQVQGAPANFEMALGEPGMKEHFIEALRNSPELFDAIVKHALLMEKLAEAQATYFGEEQQAAQ